MSPVLLRFLGSAVLGAVVAVGTAVVVAKPQLGSDLDTSVPVSVVGTEGQAVTFGVKPLAPVALQPVPITSKIQLAAFHAATPSGGTTGEIEDPWWSKGIPRIPAVSQFDGGPLEDVNCVMASGAMLARLGFGIVTTGSQLRALQDDQEGGTDFGNLAQAVQAGWGVRFYQGSLTALQLRALLYGGAGAVIIGDYGELPANLSHSPSFTGNHAIYIDGFRPPDASGGAAYYVMDPIGRTWAGYKGEWWPAEIVEHFAGVLGNGLIATMWAFPGGKVPADRPILPPSAYPGRPGQSPGASLLPSVGPDGSPITDPMPTTDEPLVDDPSAGEDTGGDPDFTWKDFDIRTNVFEVVKPDVDDCLAVPPPLGCPRGIRGIVDLGGLVLGTAPPKTDGIKILFGEAISPGMYQIIFETPPDTSSELWFWDVTDGSKLEPARVEEGVLDGDAVKIGTISLDPTKDYSFLASATGDGVRLMSSVGALDQTSS
jgi:hypothetical protein